MQCTRICLIVACTFSILTIRINCQPVTEETRSDDGKAFEPLITSSLDENNGTKDQITLAALLAHQVPRAVEELFTTDICRYIPRLWGEKYPMRDPVFKQLCETAKDLVTDDEESLNLRSPEDLFGRSLQARRIKDGSEISSFEKKPDGQIGIKSNSTGKDGVYDRRLERGNLRRQEDRANIDYTKRYLSNSLTEKVTPVIHTKSFAT